jgi:hypothetical protein
MPLLRACTKTGASTDFAPRKISINSVARGAGRVLEADADAERSVEVVGASANAQWPDWRARRLRSRRQRTAMHWQNRSVNEAPCSGFDACARARSRFKLLARSVGMSVLLHPNRVALRG